MSNKIGYVLKVLEEIQAKSFEATKQLHQQVREDNESWFEPVAIGIRDGKLAVFGFIHCQDYQDDIVISQQWYAVNMTV